MVIRDPTPAVAVGATQLDLQIGLYSPSKHGLMALASPAGSVQVFGCLHDGAIHTRQQQASEKRRGTKSRGARHCGGSNLTAGYGDLKGAPTAASAQHISASGRLGRFWSRNGRATAAGKPPAGAWRRFLSCWEASYGERQRGRGASPAAIAASIVVWKQRERRHDVLIQAGAIAGAAYRGMKPRAKTSMIIMRPPQCGHGRGRTREPSGSAFSAALASAAGETASSARALAMFCARPPLARNP